MKKTDIGVVGFMYGVCLLFLVMTLKLKPAAQTYPLFIIALLASLTTLYVANMIRDAKKKGITSGISEIFGDTLPKQFFPVLAMIIGYLIAMYFVGFYISTLVFMVCCLMFLKVPKLHIVISTLVVVGLVYGAFTMFLGVKLPLGLLFK